MDINKIFFCVISVFLVLGVVDKIIGNKLGLGNKFEEGIMTAGPLAISMIGMIVLAPVIAKVLEPVIVPLYRFLGADPSVFIGTIIANDMGGAMLSRELALDKEAGDFAGLIVGSMLGPTVTFMIPAALGVIEEQDRDPFAMGVLAGIVTVPIGAIAGGITAGYSIDMVMRNVFPVICFSLCIVIGLWRWQDKIIKGFLIFGKLITSLILVGLGVGIVQELTGYEIVKGIHPIGEGVEIVFHISMFLAGAFPLVAFLSKILQRPLKKMGSILGMNEYSTMGMISTLANSIPMFHLLKHMDKRGKVVNVAFAVSAAFLLGDHLAFTASYEPSMIMPVMVGKAVGGISAIFMALWVVRVPTK